MGEQSVDSSTNEQVKRDFMKALLTDLRALEEMLNRNLFETGIRRIGAEQEMFLVDRARKPSMTAEQMMEAITDERFTFELGKFNLEANLSPLELGGDCLRRMENEALEVMEIARSAAAARGEAVVLCGILPTLAQSHLSLDSMVPMPRYRALNDAIRQLRGSEFNLDIEGPDRLDLTHDNVMLEACNASFQIHFQVAPDEFANLYNVAQAITGPVLAAAVNSPTLLGKRLWQESRIAVFEHSIDTRSDVHRSRGLQPRVHFGDHWIEKSVLEIFQEDIARFRVVLTTDSGADPMAEIEAGRAPGLNALRLHNGTVYRWNRACYGITEGKPHLRIEHRILPSGPTVLDEVANSALFFGLMSDLADEAEEITQRLKFEDARSNFFAAATNGLRSQFTWLDEEGISAVDLLRDQLVPRARSGLERVGIDTADIDRYMGVIERRLETRQTGSRWVMSSLEAMGGGRTTDQKMRNLTEAIVVNQRDETPVSEWPIAQVTESLDWRDSYRSVSQFMTTDLFTVRADDLVDFAASLMEWKHIRHVPVEDDSGELVGLVSHHDLLRIVARGLRQNEQSAPVRDIMEPDPFCVSPDCRTVDAIRYLRDRGIGCLPVVKDRKLVGVVTEADLIDVAGQVLEAILEDQ
ncbi:MAG: CBS domain-containing protein [Pseudomonadota bacterium]